ncbi:MAG TPA: hypothetical protein VK400_02060 [Pyrinomonadaceae bacterium]|nr:hypothetical protein [Pyrinomonadaceae bacterium]
MTKYEKTYGASTGRDALTGYDAAGNITQDRIRTYPSVLNRTLTYDAAGRQVQTFDPKLHSFELDTTVTNTYDGDGRRVKNERVGAAPGTTFEIRSTVLGGETVGTKSSLGTQHRTFSAPTHDGKIIHGYQQGAVKLYQWTSPEGLREYGGEMQGIEFDPRGADAGMDDPYNNFTVGSTSYPNYSDASNYSRCSEMGAPLPCQKLGSIVERNVYQMVTAGLLPTDSAKSSGNKSSGATAHASRHNSAAAQATTATDKPQEDSQRGSTAAPASLPCSENDDEETIRVCTKAARVLINPGFTDARKPFRHPDRWMTSVNIQSKRSEVVQLAKGCKEFLDRFLNALDPGKKLIYSFDFGVLFDRVTDARISSEPKDFPKKDKDVQARAPMDVDTRGRRYIEINPYLLPNNSGERDAHITGLIVQELLHHARKNGQFSDKELDTAAISLLKDPAERQLRENYVKRSKPGSFGHGLINGNCVTKVRKD